MKQVNLVLRRVLGGLWMLPLRRSLNGLKMTRTLSFLAQTVLVFSLVFAVGCKKDKDKDDDKPTTDNVSLKGRVYDSNGSPLGGVRVTTGTLTATTDIDGKFSFNQAATVNNRTVVKFEKQGYFTLTRSNVKQSDMYIDAVLYPQGNSSISMQTTFDVSSAKTLEISGMKVALSASSIVRSDGSAYSGTVNANMLYLDPNNENFASMMPGGDLAAIRTDNSEVMLISYGMTNVNLTDNTGNLLQIKSGSTAELSFPIPAGMENNPPASMPLWHFDEDKAIWIESGIATRQGNVYVGTVTHFSWINCDFPADPVTIKGTVTTDCDNKLVPYVKITNGQSYIWTNGNGNYSGIVPANTPVTIVVKSKDYGDYSPEKSYNIPGKSGGSVVTQDISLPCIGGTSGTIGTLTWDLTNGILTISGNGAIPDFDYDDDIPWFAFSQQIRAVIIGNSVTKIGRNAFEGCYNLSGLTIGNNVKSIGESAFSGCYFLTSITIPDNVTSIGDFAFLNRGQRNTTIIQSVTIGKNVTSIGKFAFNQDAKNGWGYDVYCLAKTPPKLDLYDDGRELYSPFITTVSNTPSLGTLHVPMGYKNAYSVADGWKAFIGEGHVVFFGGIVDDL